MSIQKKGEISIKGLPGSEGIAIGKVLVLDQKKKKVQPRKIKSEFLQNHLNRYAKAKQQFLKELEELTTNLDNETAGILETQKHIVSDIEIEQRINAAIKNESYSVDYSIYKIFNEFIERLMESGSELFQQRIIDIENIRDRLIALSCENEKILEVEKGAILIVKEISPTDLVSYHEKGVAGLIMDKGGVTSHAAIIAHSLNIPCLVSTKVAVQSASLSKQAIVNATNGELILNPSKETLTVFRKKLRKIQRSKAALRISKKASETRDGIPFHLRANIEFPQELSIAKQFGAEGIGLLRTEALLYGGVAKKSESEQDIFYEQILLNSSGQVTIRLFDVGGDKLNAHTPDEANPFLGWRGIRMLLDEKEMLISQIRAILKVAGKFPGRIKILVPMISVFEEIVEVKKVITQVKKSLISEGSKVDESVEIGIMIEVPSVALLAKHFAKEVDFFSIGTNDLTQYTLAVDRGNEQISALYQQHHPSVWQLIKLTKEAADENEIDLSVCGELAGDTLGASCLIGMGINDLSMSPTSIARVKETLINQSSAELKKLSEQILACKTNSEVQNFYKSWK
ncbi:MAG: phosphoenolpyruvate--protein phosphotransferase [Balneolaceae bacterium]